MPEFEQQKSELYENCQISGNSTDAGMITENPGFKFTDSCGGRRMGDVTTLWIIEVLELWLFSNDTARLRSAWPSVIAGMEWQIAQSVDYGLPAHLVCTYDILSMERYNTTTFNGVLHLAAMRAVARMGTALGDSATVATADAAAATALAVLTGPLLWNSTYGYWRAYTGGDAIMTDCLYGQQVALAHGLGWLLPQEMIASHLAAEIKYNANPFGLTTVTGRKTPPPAITAIGGDGIAVRKAARAESVGDLMRELRSGGDGQDDAVWMGAAPTWSCLSLALGAAGPAGGNTTAALEPTRWELENYRSRLNSMWDLTGLSTTGDWGDDSANGQPFCTSHCACWREGSAQPTALPRAPPRLHSHTLCAPPRLFSHRWLHVDRLLPRVRALGAADGHARGHALLRSALRLPDDAALRNSRRRGHDLVRRGRHVDARARLRQPHAARGRAQRGRQGLRGRREPRGRAERVVVMRRCGARTALL